MPQWIRAPALLVLLTTACHDPTGTDGQVQARLLPTGIRVTNGTAAVLYYAAFEREIMALIDWIPCTDPDSCPRIRVNETITIPFSQVTGWELDSREAILYWWHLVPAGTDGYRADGITWTVVSP